MNEDVILTIEKNIWDNGRQYFDEHVCEDAYFVFPNTRLNKKEAIEASENTASWEALGAEGLQFQVISDSVAVVSYRITNDIDERVPYKAYVTSVYQGVKGRAQLIWHQHTPDK